MSPETQNSSNSQEDEARIFLVGFMGAGKTTVGRELAQHLGYRFIDLDDVISGRAGTSVQQIFAELGEPEFRRLEREALQSCAGLSRTVIALGGGAYVSDENRSLLRTIGKTIWLDCPLEVCLSRVRGDKTRPLLGDEAAMAVLLDQRRATYAQADFTIQTGELPPARLAIELTRILRTQG